MMRWKTGPAGEAPALFAHMNRRIHDMGISTMIALTLGGIGGLLTIGPGRRCC
jgi:hypothetical protein